MSLTITSLPLQVVCYGISHCVVPNNERTCSHSHQTVWIANSMTHTHTPDCMWLNEPQKIKACDIFGQTVSLKFEAVHSQSTVSFVNVLVYREQ